MVIAAKPRLAHGVEYVVGVPSVATRFLAGKPEVVWGYGVAWCSVVILPHGETKQHSQPSEVPQLQIYRRNWTFAAKTHSTGRYYPNINRMVDGNVASWSTIVLGGDNELTELGEVRKRYEPVWNCATITAATNETTVNHSTNCYDCKVFFLMLIISLAIEYRKAMINNEYEDGAAEPRVSAHGRLEIRAVF